MNLLRRYSLFLWLLLRSMRSISLGRLLMPAVFVSSWTTLCAVGTPDPIAFVWAGVLAQAAQIWGVLPVAVWRQRHAFGRSRSAVCWAVAILFGFLAFQIWWSDPWVSQRLVSVYCAWYVAMMAFGVWGDHDIMNRTVPVAKDSDVSFGFRRHLLKLYALVAILIIVTNESLMAVDAPLGTRVVVLTLLPMALHYFFEITLLLTCPPVDERNC